MPFDEYAEKSREFIQSVSTGSLTQLLDIWIDKNSRQELREELGDQDIYPSAFRHYFDLPDTDDVDVLAKIGFELTQVPTRRDRVERFWDQDSQWYETHFGLYVPRPNNGDVVVGKTDFSLAAEGAEDTDAWKIDFWRTALDHYSLFGIDDLEQARTYSAPQFVDQFGSFQSLSKRYGGAPRLKSDLEEIKHHLYVEMAK